MEYSDRNGDQVNQPTQSDRDFHLRSSIDREQINSSINRRVRFGSTARGSSFCHFFSNYGYCAYEQRTGNKCKFEHVAEVPNCKNGTACNRFKCMFKHPNSAAQTGNRAAQTGNTAVQTGTADVQTGNPVAQTGKSPDFLSMKTDSITYNNPWQIMPTWWGPNGVQFPPHLNPWNMMQLNPYQLNGNPNLKNH